MSFFSSLFSNVTISATVIDGVKIPSFKVSSALAYILSHITGSEWENIILTKVIEAVRKDGAGAQSEATVAAVAAVNAAISKAAGGNPLLTAVMASIADSDVESVVAKVFGLVLTAIKG
jgi:hypothetical protein